MFLEEVPGRAGEAGLCEPHEVQQGEGQGPAPGSGQFSPQERHGPVGFHI